MRRLFTTALAMGLCSVALAGCFLNAGEEETVELNKIEESEESSSATEVMNITPEYAAQNNSHISEDDFKLIQLVPYDYGTHVATMKTNKGEIKIILFGTHAPKAVENFIHHAEEGYYNGLSFYKVQNYFLIETGDPDGTGNGGQSIYRNEDNGRYWPFEDEFSLDLWHFRGAVSMANGGKQDNNSSPFFIVQAPYVTDSVLDEMDQIHYPTDVINTYRQTGGIPGFDWKNTIFGMVDGEDLAVVDEIAGVPVDDKNKPEELIIVESISIATLEGNLASQQKEDLLDTDSAQEERMEDPTD